MRKSASLPAPATAALLAAAFLGCSGQGDLAKRLDRLESRQDSILALLSAMKDKNEFMAMRMGWRPPPDTSYKEIPLANSPAKGADKPVLTIVEFGDLQCPFCAQLSPTLDSLLKTHPDEVKLVFKHFPLSFHPNARTAAAAALAAGKQGKFFEFRFKLAPHFNHLSDSVYLAVAKEIGLDMEKFKRDRALTPEVEKILDGDSELGRRVGVEGTPTVFINGHMALDRSWQFFNMKLAQAKVGKG